MIDFMRLESRTQTIGREILNKAARHGRGSLVQQWNNRLLEWIMRDPQLKAQVFRFVDVLPALRTYEEVVEHLHQYFDDFRDRLPPPARSGLDVADSNALTEAAAGLFVRRAADRMARRFIAGSSASQTAKTAQSMWERGMAHTIDVLGEVVVSETEADYYQAKYLDLIEELAQATPKWRPNPLLDMAGGTSVPRANVSVKLSALYSQIQPAAPEASAEGIKRRLRPVLRRAKDQGVFINFDMEHYAAKELTLRVFRETLMEPEFREWPNIGLAMQAYLRETLADAERLVDWVKERGTPVTVRLVRGAYWDYEVVISQQRKWPEPVFTQKWQTDESYEASLQLLMQNYPGIVTAAGSHNVRSIARAIALAEELNIPPDGFEIQMLYGMGDELKPAVVATERRLRVYTPYGDLIPGMAYLVRRLLENTSNESFLRHGLMEGVAPEELLRRPEEVAQAHPTKHPEPSAQAAFVNEPVRDYSKDANRRLMQISLSKARQEFGRIHPLRIGGREVTTGMEMLSINPSDPDEVVGKVSAAGPEEVEQAVRAAYSASRDWGKMEPEERAEALFRAAEIIRQRRDDLAALEVYEVAKGWEESDADVTEAIDYMEYYGREMLRLGTPQLLGRVPGEVNEYFYQPRGVAAIIAPWNFPLAILTGMSSAALVAGNAVVMKPAVQSPVIGAKLVEIYHEAGIPSGVVNLLQGGADVGEPLVRHPLVNLIAFTGSKAVGIRINQAAAEIVEGQPGMKRVIAEMGGKNAIIIDSDADLDEAIAGVSASSFGYQGQKCSASARVIVLKPAYEEFVDRFVASSSSLRIGPPEDPANFVGPLVDEAALKKVRSYIDLGKQEGRLLLEREAPGPKGYYVGPTIFADVDPKARIAQEEIFGPVVVVMKAESIDEALDIAMGTEFALTGGLYSRSPKIIERVKRDYRTGNLYINRKITGAIVGRQPFGGLGFSGIGSKAGGPDYLLQFMEPRVVTENTMRRGFSPETL